MRSALAVGDSAAMRAAALARKLTGVALDYVVMTQWCKPFSPKALAENSATTRQIMGILGHDDIQHAELYTREAEQRGLAADGMEKLVDWRKKPSG